MARKKTNPHVGSDFEDFLAEEGRLQESTALAIKRVHAWEFARVMKETNVTQAELARRMRTSRAVVQHSWHQRFPVHQRIAGAAEARGPSP